MKRKMADALKKAIKGEVDGHIFYDLLAEKATNDEARRRLEQLRDDEVRHKEVLYDMYDLIIGGRPERLPDKGINALADVFRRGRLDERKTEIEFINLAIDAELAATQFYQAQREKFDDPQFHALLDQLADEENGHYELLQAEKEAMGGNYHWFSLDHSNPMEY